MLDRFLDWIVGAPLGFIPAEEYDVPVFFIATPNDLYRQGERIERQLAEVLAALEEFRMSVSKDLKDLTAKFDAATDEIAADLVALKSQIKNSMTDEELADVKATIQAKIDRLTVLGQDDSNPVPPTP